MTGSRHPCPTCNHAPNIALHVCPILAAHARIVSGGGIWLNRRKSARRFNILQSTFLSSSPSLSGRVGVKRFQAAPSIWCGMSLAGSSLLFGIGIWAFPMMGSGGCGGPISRRVLAVRLTAGIGIRNGLASSIVPAGTSLHRSAEFRFSPVVFLLCTTRCEISRVIWPQLLLWSNETRCHPPTCDA